MTLRRPRNNPPQQPPRPPYGGLPAPAPPPDPDPEVEVVPEPVLSITDRARSAAERHQAAETERIDAEVKAAEKLRMQQRQAAMQLMHASDLRNIIPSTDMQYVAHGNDFVVVRPIDEPDDRLHFLCYPKPHNHTKYAVALVDCFNGPSIEKRRAGGHVNHWLRGAYPVETLAELGNALMRIDAQRERQAAAAAAAAFADGVTSGQEQAA